MPNRYPNSSNNVFVSCKPLVSNPFVNQLQISDSKSWDSGFFPRFCHSRGEASGSAEFPRFGALLPGCCFKLPICKRLIKNVYQLDGAFIVLRIIDYATNST